MNISKLIVAAIAVGATTAGSALSQDQGYSTTFSQGEGYTGVNSGDIGFPVSGQDGWVTNDPFNAMTDAGEANYVEFVAGTPDFTPGSFAAGNYSAILGGIHGADGFFPGRADSEISRSFTPITPTVAQPSASLIVDFGILSSDLSFPEQDTFGFDLRNNVGASLAKFTFNPNTGLSGADLDFEWTLNGVIQTTSNTSLNGNNGIAYDAKYRLVAEITGSILDVSISALDATTNQVVSTASIIQGGSTSGSLTTGDFNTFATTWDLANTSTTTPGLFENAGYNAIVLNAVTAVPEPSTVALAVVISLGGLAFARRKRQSAA
ncbi:MAG: PEP-CTERM sorting domain-containing protein [Chthoniobacterales bacterium]